MVIEILIFLVSLAFIIKGSDLFVKSSSKIARKLGVSEFVIGLTLVALGTSLPELVSSIIASTKHESGLIVGTIVGANVADLTLVAGIAVLITSIKLRKIILRRDIYEMIFAILLLGFFLMDGKLSRIEGLILLVAFLGYNIYLFNANPKTKSRFINSLKHLIKHEPENEKSKAELEREKLHLQEFIIFLIGGAMLYLGANYLVKEAVFFSELLGISTLVVGIIISIGTTMPEISVSITSSRKGLGEIAIGNAIGSVITNTLLILGTSSLIFPISIIEKTSSFLIPFLFGISIVLGIFVVTKWRLSKIEGMLLILAYVAFLILGFKII
jgi:cation:H+ antiporter